MLRSILLSYYVLPICAYRASSYQGGGLCSRYSRLFQKFKRIGIRKEEARLKREDDFIDQELKEKAANTDVGQSQADVNRNLSSGQKTLLEKVGEAEVKKNSGFFK